MHQRAQGRWAPRQQRPRPLTLVEIEDHATANVRQFERTALAQMYEVNWRYIALDNFIVGMAPFPDCRLVLSMHTANCVLHGLYEYLVDDKERVGPLPMTLFLPRKTRQGVDYWWTDNIQDVIALANYTYMSTSRASPNFAAWYAHFAADLPIFRTFLRLYATQVDEGGVEPYLLWPSMYWARANSGRVTLRALQGGLAGIQGERDQVGDKALGDFTKAWTNDLVHGSVEDLTFAVRRDPGLTAAAYGRLMRAIPPEDPVDFAEANH
jgi:hypothetical protein